MTSVLRSDNRGKGRVKTEAEAGMMQPCATGCLEPLKLGETRNRLSHRAFVPADTLSSDFWLLELWENEFLLF